MPPDLESQMVRILRTFNPWWETHEINDVEPFRRRDFNFLESLLPEKRIISIVGARQVGKTTLMQQLIQSLLQNRIDNRILLIYGNNFELNTISKNVIKDSLEAYEKFVLKEEITKTKKEVYVFIDEVQHIKNWFNITLDYFSLNKRIKFIVSGSSSARIIEESRKALVGRVQNQIVVPFKFLEALRFYYFNNHNAAVDFLIAFDISRIRDEFRKLIEMKKITKRNISNFFEILRDKYNKSLVYEKTIKHLLDVYFVKGGYPAIVKEDIIRKCVDLLSTNISDVVNTDIANLHNIRENELMYKILVLISRNTSEILSVAKIANDLETDIKTVTEYIRYLEDVFIISTAENYRFSKRSRLKKKLKKIYINDIGMRNVINNSFNDSILRDDAEMGRIVETVVYDHTLRLKFKISPQYRPELFYWREDGEEVDIILEHKGRPIPIEVKYRNRIDNDDLKNIKKFVQDNKSGFGICVTKDTFGMNDEIMMIPAWMFILIC